MEERYDASGYQWDDCDKMKELTEQGARFIVIRQRIEGDRPGELVGFAHFRFTVQGDVADTMAGEPILMLWDLHIVEEMQRKGLGKHILTVLELIARREKMKMISVPVQLYDNVTTDFIAKCKGFAPDTSLKSLVDFDAEMEGFDVYTKLLIAPAPRAAVTAMASTPVKASKKEVGSPIGVADIIDNPVSESREALGDDVEEDVSNLADVDLDEHVIIKDLKAMFVDTHKHEATEEICQQWLVEIRSAQASAATPPAAPTSADKPSTSVDDSNKENIPPKNNKTASL